MQLIHFVKIMYIFLHSFSTCMVTEVLLHFLLKMMLMVQTSEYIEDSHHQYELASLISSCMWMCISTNVHVLIVGLHFPYDHSCVNCYTCQRQVN